jgi:hypothetical protein
MRPNSTAMSNRASPQKPLAIARTSQGIRIVPTSVNTIRTPARPLKASRAKPAASSPRSSFLAYIGTKAMLKAPSAKNRRNMLGSEKAMRNASATGPAPR